MGQGTLSIQSRKFWLQQTTQVADLVYSSQQWIFSNYVSSPAIISKPPKRNGPCVSYSLGCTFPNVVSWEIITITDSAQAVSKGTDAALERETIFYQNNCRKYSIIVSKHLFRFRQRKITYLSLIQLHVRVVFNYVCSLETMACLMISALNLVCLFSYLFPSLSSFSLEVLYFLLQIYPVVKTNSDKL